MAYYSKLYGPQVLLQMNIAYFVPSIPVLILFGHVENLLNAQLGPTMSMLARITFGMLGCAMLCAWFPFIPQHAFNLLAIVAALGCFSAIAFSTSYQLVSWFRSADTIALGIGCVASGPTALLIQICLQIGPRPKPWQWIAMFEIAAGLVVVGLLAALSILYQYWNILSGHPLPEQHPLLEEADQVSNRQQRQQQ
jgi:MFS family permease